MRKWLWMVGAVVVIAVCVPGWGNSFVAATRQMGYQGTIWNITDATGPWATSTPRNGTLFFDKGFVPSHNSRENNQLMSSWSYHAPSNVNDSFFQLVDPYLVYTTYAEAYWDPTLTVLSLSVAGQNTPYAAPYYSRMWQPDTGTAWGVTFTDYAYSFTVTYANPATPHPGFPGYYENTGLAASIAGNFSGEYVVTVNRDDLNNLVPVINGDRYGFNINFNSDWYVTDTGNPAMNNYFLAEVVPEPLTMLSAFLAIGGLGAYMRKRVRTP